MIMTAAQLTYMYVIYFYLHRGKSRKDLLSAQYQCLLAFSPLRKIKKTTCKYLRTSIAEYNVHYLLV